MESQVTSDGEREWLEQVIPLPKQARIDAAWRVRPEQVHIAIDGDDAALTTAAALLQQALPGATLVWNEEPAEPKRIAFVLEKRDDGNGQHADPDDRVVAMMALPSERPEGRVDLDVRVTSEEPDLKDLPNAEQAYCIVPMEPWRGLELAGLTPLATLYAVRTFVQLIRHQGDEVEIPRVDILDWPDLEERGQWGGNSEVDADITAALKLNLVETCVEPAFDGQGNVHLGYRHPEFPAHAREIGVHALPFLPHIGALGFDSELFRHRPDLASTPDRTQPLPTDYQPGLCFSAPETEQFVTDLLLDAVQRLHVEQINVWLTEEDVPCYCERCRQENTYVTEARLLSAVAQRVQQVNPAFRLRVLLTQGSYPVNDQVLAALSPNVQVTYYSGATTYDSSHQPMIYPLLADFAARGRWLGVYPQVGNSWRTVFPFSGAQFIRFRMLEFVGKGLRSVTGYAPPANVFHRFNLAALAEWSWNAHGRDEHQFARAWARRQGIADVEGFARWATLIGPLGWDLAGSRFPMSLFWDPARTILRGDKALVFGEGLLAELPSAEHLARNLMQAREALHLAESLDEPACISESAVVLNSYRFLGALIAIAGEARSAAPLPPDRREQLAVRLGEMDDAAEGAVRALWQWGCLCFPEMPVRFYHRFEETLSVYAQVLDEAYALGNRLGIADPRPEYRDQRIGGWSEADFAVPETHLALDITEQLAGPGVYRVTFRFLGGAYGANVSGLRLVEREGGQARTIAEAHWPVDQHPGRDIARVGRYEAWNDMRLVVPALHTGCRYELQADMNGIPADAPQERRTSAGEILLRRAWA